MKPSRRCDEDGSITLWLLGLSVLLLGLGGMGLDLWRVQVARADLAALANAAASAGAGHLDPDAFRRDRTVQLDLDPSTGAAAAAWSVLNGDPGGGVTRLPQVVVAPDVIEVTLTTTVRFGLLAVLLPASAEAIDLVVIGRASPRESGP